MSLPTTYDEVVGTSRLSAPRFLTGVAAYSGGAGIGLALLLAGDRFTQLGFAAWLLLLVVLLPFLITGFDWRHPIVLQVPLMAVQSMALIAIGVGLLPLDNTFSRALPTAMTEALFLKAVAVKGVGSVAVCGAAFLRWGGGRTQRTRFNLPLRRHLGLLAAGALVLAWGANSAIVLRTGSLVEMFTMMRYRLELYEGLAYLVQLTKLGTVAAILLLFRGNGRSAVLVVVVQCLIAVSMGDRGDVIFFTLLPFLIALYHHRGSLSAAPLIALGLGLAIFYQAVGEFRRSGELTLRGGLSGEGFVQTLGDVEHHQITASVIGLVDSGQVELLKGRQLPVVFVAPIPRALWAGKPVIAESALVGQMILGRRFHGLPAGMFGYGYLNFGWLGVILFGLVGGATASWFFRALVCGYDSPRDVPRGNVLVFSVLAFLVPFVLSTEVQIGILMNLPILIVVLWLGSGAPRGRAEA